MRVHNISFSGVFAMICGPLSALSIEILKSPPLKIYYIGCDYNYKMNIDDLSLLNQFFLDDDSLFYIKRDLVDYSKLNNITRVVVNPENNKINLEGLEFLKNLKSLNLGHFSKKMDISPILDFKQTLTGLKFVNDTKKGGEQIISELKHLKNLTLTSTKFSSFDFLANLPIEDFWFYGSRTNTVGLENLKMMKRFFLKLNKWEDYNFLKYYPLLEEIEFWYVSGIRKFPDLHHLKYLRRVHLWECNKLQDIEHLKTLQNCNIMANGAQIEGKTFEQNYKY